MGSSRQISWVTTKGQKDTRLWAKKLTWRIPGTHLFQATHYSTALELYTHRNSDYRGINDAVGTRVEFQLGYSAQLSHLLSRRMNSEAQSLKTPQMINVWSKICSFLLQSMVRLDQQNKDVEVMPVPSTRSSERWAPEVSAPYLTDVLDTTLLLWSILYLCLPGTKKVRQQKAPCGRSM